MLLFEQLVRSIDLNCDMGEGCPNDAELMNYVSSVNIACGYHAGDTETMKQTVNAALVKQLAIGAHPGFPDRNNFGRTPMSLPLETLYDIVSEQIELLQQVCRSSGTRLHHVKPHGSLYNQAARKTEIAAVIARAVHDSDSRLVLYGLSGSVSISEAEKYGLATASEAFADRTYRPDGSLTPRTDPNALISDSAIASAQALSMEATGTVTAVNGSIVRVRADTICIHGDGEHAVEFARAISTGLRERGIQIQSIRA